MDTKHIKLKRTIGIISFIVFIGITLLIGIFFVKHFDISNPDKFREQIEGYGGAAWIVAICVQILQIVIALIPGEAIEICAGYAFGAIGGTAICLIGSVIASTIVFLFTKKWGVKFVELFVSIEKVNSLSFLKNEAKLKKLIFLLYLIPGTPKDLLTYIAGLTKIKLSEFLLLSSIARLPSIVSSTIGGKFVAEKNWIAVIVVFGITAVVSLIGLLIYNKLTAQKSKRQSSSNIEE